MIVTETNTEAEYFYNKLSGKNPNKIRTYTPIDRAEIEAYIGLLFTLEALY